MAAGHSQSHMQTGFFTKRAVLAAAVPSGLIVIGLIDFATGFDLLMSFFYLLPVALCAWHFDRPAVIAAGLFAGCVWFAADLASNPVYENTWVRFWNAAMCTASTLGIGILLNYLRRTLREREEANAALQAALTKLEASTKEARALTDQLQVVCAWTQRIRIDGKWMNLDEFLSNHLKLKLTHGMSPEAMAKMLAELEQVTNQAVE